MLQRVDAFRAQVAQHYRQKGYDVREGPRVRGASGQVYAVDMVCEGPLGAILVSFGDAGGVDGHELGRARVMAKDIGASPVVAAPSFDPEVARVAAHLGVALIDATAAAGILPPPAPEPVLMPDRVTPRSLDEDLRAHPWPRSGTIPAAGPLRASEVDDLVRTLSEPAPAPAARAPSSAAQALWGIPASALGTEPQGDAPLAPAPAVQQRQEPFAWLRRQAQQAVAEVAAEAQPEPAHTTAHRVVYEDPQRVHWMRWLVAAAAVLGVVLLANSGFFSA